MTRPTDAAAQRPLAPHQRPLGAAECSEITVSHTKADMIRFWLEHNTGDNRLSEENTVTVTAEFDDIDIDIKCCGSDNSTAWTEGVMFNKEGFQLSCTDPDDTFFGVWDFELDGVSYRVVVNEESD